MKIAACYIVKNEEKNLRKSLESVARAVDELVVVDTGSEDNTVEIARDFGANVFFYQWRNHFADARNFALEQVKSPWLIFLDADEAFLHPEEVRPAIEEYLDNEPEADALMVLRYNVDVDGGGDRSTDIALRILRNASSLRYTSRIHEHLKRQDGRELRLVFTDERLAVSHTGYSSLRIVDKARRDLALLEQEVEALGGVATPFLNGHLADAYYIIGDYRRALECALLALESEARFVGAEGSKYHVALESMRRLNVPPEDMLPLAQLATRELPELPEFYGEQGIILSAMGQLEEAKFFLKKAIDIHREHPVSYRESSYFDDDCLAVVYQRLGEIAHLQGEEKQAEAYFRRAVSIVPKNESVIDAYGNFLKERESKEKRIFLSACYIVRDEAENLIQSLESIKGETDELIVVDTGSTDDTVAVAKAYNARVFSFPWTGDFSAARNFALEHARGDWILFLDADEYFTPETRGDLRQVLDKYSRGNQLMVFLRNFDKDTGEFLLDTYVPRIFRNREDFRYEGRIHEELRQNGKEIQGIATVPKEELTLIHTGYSGSVNRKKAERNLALLLEELKTSKHPERLYMYLAEACDGVEDDEQAMFYAEKDIETGRKPVVYASRSYRILLRLLAKRPNESDRRMQAAAWAVRDFPEIPEFHAEYAECLVQHGKFREALEELEKAEHAFEISSAWEPVLFPEEMRPMLEKRREFLLSKLGETEVLGGSKEKRSECCKLSTPEAAKMQEIELLWLLEILFRLEREEPAPEIYNSCKELLTPTLRNIWDSYEIGSKCMGNMDEYRMILSIAVVCADDSQLLRYVDLLETRDSNQIYAVGNCLMEGERWQAAFSCYAMIPEGSDCVDEEFWYRTGRCLYNLGEWAGAEECLTRALKLSPDYFPAKSFLQWVQEGKSICASQHV